MTLPIDRLVVATRNAGKLAEIRHALDGLVGEVVGLDAVPEAPEVEEDGVAFAQNAAKKAAETARALGGTDWVLADDSGLVVDVLGGKPGVWSARYADAEDRVRLGVPLDAGQDVANNAKLLDAMQEVPLWERTARFVAVLALADPEGQVTLFEGVCEGSILFEPRGKGGFGYDPLFLPRDEKRSMAELPIEGKNLISHRGRALAALWEWLKGRD